MSNDDLQAEPVLVYSGDLPPGMLTHDECSFNDKDGMKQGWVKVITAHSLIKDVATFRIHGPRW